MCHVLTTTYFLMRLDWLIEWMQFCFGLLGFEWRMNENIKTKQTIMHAYHYALRQEWAVKFNQEARGF
jgi:hypothetical protein